MACHLFSWDIGIRADVLSILHLETNFLEIIIEIENFSFLTHWGRVTHIFIGNLTIIGSDNGLSLGQRQAII